MYGSWNLRDIIVAALFVLQSTNWAHRFKFDQWSPRAGALSGESGYLVCYIIRTNYRSAGLPTTIRRERMALMEGQ